MLLHNNDYFASSVLISSGGKVRPGHVVVLDILQIKISILDIKNYQTNVLLIICIIYSFNSDAFRALFGLERAGLLRVLKLLPGSCWT